MAWNANTQVSLAKVAEYVEAMTRDPKSRAFVPLSEIYRQAGMFDDAQSVILKGIKQNPDYSLGYIALGRTLVAKGVTEKAEKAFRKALQMDPESLPALKALLRLVWEKGDAEGARETAEAVYRVKPGDSDAEKILQHLAVQREKEATSAAPKITEGEEPIKTATLADIYVRQGLFEKALNVYRQILGRDPQNELVKRKAQAVKKRLEEQRAQDAQSSSQEARTAEPRSDAEKTASLAQDTSAATEAAPDSNEAIIRTLEGWVDSIRQRREHVQ